MVIFKIMAREPDGDGGGRWRGRRFGDGGGGRFAVRVGVRFLWGTRKKTFIIISKLSRGIGRFQLRKSASFWATRYCVRGTSTSSRAETARTWSACC